MLAILIIMFGLLIWNKLPAWVDFVGDLTVTMTLRLPPEGDLLKGFANPSVVTVAAGICSTCAISFIADKLVGLPHTLNSAQLEILPRVGAASAFLNTTPPVAMIIPVLKDMGQAARLAVSKQLIQFSFASILGGATTVIGASTNLVIAGLVVGAIAGMFKWREMLRLYPLHRLDFTLAFVTFLGVLTFNEALWALLLAFVWRTSQGQMTELGLASGRLTFKKVGSAPGVTPISGLLIFAPEESLFFANADSIRVQITNRLAITTEQVDSLLLDLELTNEIDVPSADMLKELYNGREKADVQLMLARLRQPMRDLMNRSGVTRAIGEEHIYGRVLEAVIHYLSEKPTVVETLLPLSGNQLKLLQEVVNGLLVHAKGDQRVKLKALCNQLSMMIDGTARSLYLNGNARKKPLALRGPRTMTKSRLLRSERSQRRVQINMDVKQNRRLIKNPTGCRHPKDLST
jgi:hypothetical protein